MYQQPMQQPQPPPQQMYGQTNFGRQYESESTTESESDNNSGPNMNNGDGFSNRFRAERSRLENELDEKKEILYQMDRLEAKGYSLPRKFNMQSNIEEMKAEYHRVLREKEIDASIRFQRKMLMAFVSGTEYLNTRYDPFSVKLEGWSEQIHENIIDYDDIFEELHEKYKAKGNKMAPELRLFISLSGSAFMFHLTSKMFKESSIPGVEEVFKANPDLMKQFQNAAAKQFIHKNTGMEIPQKQQSRGDGSGGSGLFGMIGNLFGGLSNTPSFNSPPHAPVRQQPMKRSENEINNIINNNQMETLKTGLITYSLMNYYKYNVPEIDINYENVMNIFKYEQIIRSYSFYSFSIKSLYHIPCWYFEFIA